MKQYVYVCEQRDQIDIIYTHIYIYMQVSPSGLGKANL